MNADHLNNIKNNVADDSIEQGLYFQPIIDWNSNTIFGYEALTRWRCGDNVTSAGAVGSEFIPWGIVDPETLRLIKDNRHKISNSPIFLNVSNETLASDVLFKQWLIYIKCLIKTNPIYVEINEDVPCQVLSKRWGSLDKLGVKLAMDDFGFGYSSYERLSSYPWSVCKFDSRRILKGLDTEAIYLCNKLNLLTVVEFIENNEVSRRVSIMGMHLHQGFFRSGMLSFS